MGLFGKGLPPMPRMPNFGDHPMSNWDGDISEYFDAVTKYMSAVSASIDVRNSKEPEPSGGVMEVKFKRFYKDAVIPSYATDGDAGLDLTAHSWTETDTYIEYDTAIGVEIPVGYVGLVFQRSSVSKLYTGFYLRNAVGVIDSGYRGSIKCRFSKLGFMSSPAVQDNIYQIGDKIAQLIIMPYPTIKLVEVDELSDSTRGEGGYGSTGR